MTLTASTKKMPPSRIAEQLVLREDREHAEPAAERERADVAHEDLRWVGVVPEEADARADDRAAVDRELAGRRDLRDVEVRREREARDGRAGDVRPDEVRARVDHHRADREPVEAVGEVDRVRRRDDDEDRERDVDPERQVDRVLRERDERASRGAS